MKRTDLLAIWEFTKSLANQHIEDADLSEWDKHKAREVMTHLCYATNENLTSCAGRANYKTYGVEISGPIFDQTYVVAQIIDTILHEIAHHLAYRVNKEPNHGQDWIKWAELIGCSAERTHAMPRARKKTKQEEAISLRSTLKL